MSFTCSVRQKEQKSQWIWFSLTNFAQKLWKQLDQRLKNCVLTSRIVRNCRTMSVLYWVAQLMVCGCERRFSRKNSFWWILDVLLNLLSPASECPRSCMIFRHRHINVGYTTCIQCRAIGAVSIYQYICKFSFYRFKRRSKLNCAAWRLIFNHFVLKSYILIS